MVTAFAFSLLSVGVAGAASGTKWGIAGGQLGYLYNPPNHNGEDAKQDSGTPVRALHSGCVFRVKDTGSVGGYNQEITVRYNEKGSMGKRWVLYGHTREGSMLRDGACFKRGEQLARVGTRSDSNGSVAHAHIQVWETAAAATGYKNSEALNPAATRKTYGEL